MLTVVETLLFPSVAAVLDRRGAWSVCRLYRTVGDVVAEFTRTSEGELVLLTLYAKAKIDNLTGAKLKEIRRALEE